MAAVMGASQLLLPRAASARPRLAAASQAARLSHQGRALFCRALSGSSRRTVATRAAVSDDSPASSETELAEEPEVTWAAFMAHQAEAPHISSAEEARTLMAAASTGMLSTMSVAKMSEGYPFGSMINLVTDEQGRPVTSISTLSLHTSDLKANSRCSVTVTTGGFESLADARFTLTGEMTLVPEEEVDAVRSLFLAKNPDCYYVDFGDFAFYRMDNVVGGHFIGGFGRVKQMQASTYLDCEADPIAPCSAPVAGHMNSDHGDANNAMIQAAVGMDVSDAKIVSLDRLGMNMVATLGGQPQQKVRLPFPRPAEDRKDVKTLIVEMTKAAAEFMPEA